MIEDILGGVPQAPMPDRIRPMLVNENQDPLILSRAGWLFEPKLDGYRAMARVDKGEVMLYSRSLKSFDYPLIRRDLKQLTHQVILDGEVVVRNEHGIPNRRLLMAYSRRWLGPPRLPEYYVFDVVYLDDHNLRRLPLESRKLLLEEIITDLPYVKLCTYTDEGLTLGLEVAEKKFEGIVAKRADSPYRPGRRTMDWVKLKLSPQTPSTEA